MTYIYLNKFVSDGYFFKWKNYQKLVFCLSILNAIAYTDYLIIANILVIINLKRDNMYTIANNNRCELIIKNSKQFEQPNTFLINY